MPADITDPQQFEDESLVEDFYRLLPLFMGLFIARPALVPDAIDTLVFDGTEYVLDKAKADQLLRLYRNKKHLKLGSLQLLDAKKLSTPVQRLIRAKQNK
jgi:hypothetical protein